MPSLDLTSLILGQGGAVALILARTLGVAWVAPSWGANALGWRLRLALAGLLTLVLVPTVGAGLDVPTSLGGLGRALIVEAAIGVMLGMSAALIVAGARQAGEVVGGQAGLSAAALLDPEAGGDMTPLGHLYGLVALMVFLALDGPVMLVKSLAESYQVVPAGGLALTPETAGLAFGQVGQALELALRAAAPIALALASAGLALGLLGRAAPSLQWLSLSLPARTAIGLLFVLMGLGTLAGMLSAAWGAWFAGGGGISTL